MIRTLLAPLCIVAALSGCDAISGIFAESNKLAEEGNLKQATPEEKAAARQAEAAARVQVVAGANAKLERKRSQSIEPGPMAEKIPWLIEKRVSCHDYKCSKRYLARFKTLTGLVSPLLAAMDSGAPEHQIEAMRLVGLLEVRDLAVQVSKRLESPSKPVRKAAISSLRWLKHPATLAPILDRLRGLHDAEERRWLLGAMAEFDDDRATNALRKGALDSNVSTAIAATSALGKRKGEMAINALDSTISNSESPAVKRTAMDALGDAGTGPALEILKRWTRKGGSEMRAFAKQVLARKARKRR